MCFRKVFPLALMFLTALPFVMYPQVARCCDPIPTEVVSYFLTAPSDIAAAPARMESNGTQIVFSCDIPEYCGPVDIYIAFLSPTGNFYFPDIHGNMTKTPQACLVNSTGNISRTFSNNGYVFTFGAWRVFWLVVPTGGDPVYELGNYRILLDNTERLLADEECPIKKPEYRTDRRYILQILTVGADYFESRAGAKHRFIVSRSVDRYPIGSARLSINTPEGGEPVLRVPSRAAAYYLAGVEAFFQNSKDVSTWCFFEAARRDPYNAAYINNVAFNLFQYNLYEVARDLLHFAKSISPNYNSVNVNLGFACDKIGRYREAAYYYQTAFYKDMENPDYLRLLISSLEKLDCGDYLADFYRSLLSSLETAAARAAFGPGSGVEKADYMEIRAHSEAYNDVMDGIDEIMDQARDDMRDFVDDALTPVLINFFEAMGTCPVECADPYPGHCEYNRCVNVCMIPPALQVRQKAIGLIGTLYERKQSAIFQIESLIFSYHSGLTGTEYNELLELAQRMRDNLNESYRSVLSTIPDSGRVSSYIDAIESAGCELTQEEEQLRWIFGEQNDSFEPAACYFIVCVSMDHEGMGAVSLSAIVLSTKVGYNPFNGDTLVQFGIGPGEVGVGPITVEGSIYLKIEGTTTGEGTEHEHTEFQRIGIQPTMGIGPFEEGYFFGLERI